MSRTKGMEGRASAVKKGEPGRTREARSDESCKAEESVPSPHLRLESNKDALGEVAAVRLVDCERQARSRRENPRSEVLSLEFAPDSPSSIPRISV